MKVYAIANFKGGTGKTTTAVNLAAMLARDGQRVLLIDADAQHNATNFFILGTEGGITLTDVLEGLGETVWEDNISPSGRERLWLLPADMGLLTLDLSAILHGTTAGFRRFQDFMDAMGQDGEVDSVVIDCPPSFTAASVAALANADELILPTRVDDNSRRGVLELLEQVESLPRTATPARCRILVTMADRSNVSKQGEELLRAGRVEVFKTVIRRGIAVDEATYARQPLFEYKPKSAPARDYEAFLVEVLADG